LQIIRLYGYIVLYLKLKSMTSDQKQKLKMYNNVDLLYIIDLLDKILNGNTGINNKTL